MFCANRAHALTSSIIITLGDGTDVKPSCSPHPHFSLHFTPIFCVFLCFPHLFCLSCFTWNCDTCPGPRFVCTLALSMPLNCGTDIRLLFTLLARSGAAYRHPPFLPFIIIFHHFLLHLFCHAHFQFPWPASLTGQMLGFYIY